MTLLNPTESFTNKAKELKPIAINPSPKKNKHKILMHMITSSIMFLTGFTGIILTEKYYF